MANYYDDSVKDEVILPVYFRALDGSLGLYHVECPLQDIKQNVKFAHQQVAYELFSENYARRAAMVLIKGGKA